MAEWMWLVKFLFGAFLAYYVMSPKLRHFINSGVRKSVEFLFPMRDKILPTRIEKPRIVVNKSDDVSPEVIDLDAGKNQLLVGEDEVEKWLKDNPDLRRVNGV